jgi:hypothetical protein
MRAEVDQFLRQCYFSAGELLPHKLSNGYVSKAQNVSAHVEGIGPESVSTMVHMGPQLGAVAPLIGVPVGKLVYPYHNLCICEHTLKDDDDAVPSNTLHYIVTVQVLFFLFGICVGYVYYYVHKRLLGAPELETTDCATQGRMWLLGLISQVLQTTPCQVILGRHVVWENRFEVYMDENCNMSVADVRDRLVRDMLDSKNVLPMDQQTQNPKTLPQRHLPPGKPVDLYMMYVATCMKARVEAASSRTFRRVWKDWSHCLEFRKSSTHTMCKSCHKLKHQIRSAVDFSDHVLATEKYLAHLQAQWADRQAYWALRARARSERDVLHMICDGMDRSKFALPRWLEGRQPKDSVCEHVQRPVCELSACLVHGVGCYMFIADENVVIGSSWVAETVLHSVDRAFAWFEENAIPFPKDLIIHGDNTNRELKNSVMGRLCAFLVGASYFRMAGHQHLRVGHTHEDIGGL